MVPVLFIAGTSYCGSTLTSLVLNCHPQLASVGELTGPNRPPRDAPEYPCSCGETLERCGFWREVGRRAGERGVSFAPEHWDLRFLFAPNELLSTPFSRSVASKPLDDLRHAALARLPGLRGRLAEVGLRNRAVMEAILETTGARVFVDASKDPVRARFLSRVPGLDVRLLHLVRDPRGFVASDQGRSHHTLRWSAHIWNRSAAHVDCARRALPADRFLRVRYEDLCGDVEGGLRRITAFAGVAPFASPLRLEGEHHVIGNKMRKAGIPEIRLDEGWRERLDAAQITAVERLTRATRTRLGYA